MSRAGSVDWWCPARFDAPYVFARLLDPQLEVGHQIGYASPHDRLTLACDRHVDIGNGRRL